MASVYKAVSKKQARQQEREEEPEDAEMEDLLADADDTSDSEEEEDEEGQEAGDSSNKPQLPAGFLPKTRVLMLTSRGVTHRYVLTKAPAIPSADHIFRIAIDTCSPI